jgi:two-component system chemotaxis response regulator CheY
LANSDSSPAGAAVAIRSILVVDNDPSTLIAMCRVLEAMGYLISVATAVHDAIRLLTRESADLVITDLLMPRGDGFELIIALHRNFPTIPVIAMSGGGHLYPEAYLEMARGFHIDGTLKKPVSRDELMLAITAVENRTTIGTVRSESRTNPLFVETVPDEAKLGPSMPAGRFY